MDLVLFFNRDAAGDTPLEKAEDICQSLVEQQIVQFGSPKSYTIDDSRETPPEMRGFSAYSIVTLNNGVTKGQTVTALEKAFNESGEQISTTEKMAEISDGQKLEALAITTIAWSP